MRIAEERMFQDGEPGAIRTRDPLIKSQMLYRLSYGLDEMILTESKIQAGAAAV